MSIRYMSWPAALLLAGGPAAAAPQPPSNAVVGGVLSCRQIKPDALRLACFDKSASALNDAVVQHDVTVLDKEEVRRTRRSLFGFSLPNLQLFGIGSKGEAEAPEATTLDGRIVSVRAVSYGKWDMELEEHMVWRNVDLLDSPPAAGEKVHIKKGVLGSYFLTIGADRPVRAMRVR